MTALDLTLLLALAVSLGLCAADSLGDSEPRELALKPITSGRTLRLRKPMEP